MKRWICIGCGLLCLVLAGIGVLLPILPTTPFVLLAGFLFSSSSPHLARRLEQSALFGPYIQHYRTHSGVPRRTKRIALIWLWSGIGISAYFSPKPYVTLLLLAVGVGVSLHLILLKSRSDTLDLGQSDKHADRQDQQGQDDQLDDRHPDQAYRTADQAEHRW